MADPLAGPSAATTDWEARAKEMERQMRGLSEERNRYKNQAEAWTRLANDPVAQGAITYAADGTPAGWDLTDPNPSVPFAQQAGNPFAQSGIDPNAAQEWLQQSMQSLAAQQGFVTQAQAQALANQAATQAYQLANHKFTVNQSVNKLLSNKSYADLADPNSAWAKRTADYLQQQQAGRPSREGAGWDEWDYLGPQVLQQAADITYAQMVRDGQLNAQSQQSAIQAQNAAGLSAGPTQAAVPVDSTAQVDKLIANNAKPDEIYDVVAKQLEANWRASGQLTG